MNKITKILYNSFLRIKGWWLAITGVTVTIAAFYFEVEYKIGIKFLLPFVLFIFFLLAILVDSLIYCYTNTINKLPRVIRSCPTYGLYQKMETILLLEKSVLFSHETLVTIYHKYDDYEELIGNGFVTTIQENGAIQVVVYKSEEHHIDIWKKIKENNIDTIKNLLVKPTVTKSVYYSEGS